MTGVEQDDVTGRVEGPVEGDGQLDDAEVGPEVTTRTALVDLVDDELPDLVAELVEFGSLGPIIMVTWFIPTIMGWDIRKEAVALAKKMAGGNVELEPGQFDAVGRVATRFYLVAERSRAAGRSASGM